MSSDTRFVFAAGLERTGHHAVQAMCLAIRPLCTSDSQLTALLWSNGSLARGILAGRTSGNHTAALRSSFVARLREVQQRNAGRLIVLNTFNVWGSGMMSYPNFRSSNAGPASPDLTVLAELTREAGVELRVLALMRDAREVLVSTTAHQHFGTPASEGARLARYAAVLSTQLSTITQHLHGPASRTLVLCVPYERLGDSTWWAGRDPRAPALTRSTWLHPQLTASSAWLPMMTRAVHRWTPDNATHDDAIDAAIGAADLDLTVAFCDPPTPSPPDQPDPGEEAQSQHPTRPQPLPFLSWRSGEHALNTSRPKLPASCAGALRPIAGALQISRANAARLHVGQLVAQVYVLCVTRCSLVPTMIPDSWNRTLLLDGKAYDACLGLDPSTSTRERVAWSHLALLLDAREASHRHVLVLEEDAIFSDVAWPALDMQAFKTLLQSPDWMTIKLGWHYCGAVPQNGTCGKKNGNGPANRNLEGRQQEVAIRISSDHEHRDCPHECLCELRHQWCVVQQGCDIRASHAYIASPRGYGGWLSQWQDFRRGIPRHKGIDSVWQIYPQVLVVPPLASQEKKTALFEDDMRIFESSCVLGSDPRRISQEVTKLTVAVGTP